MLHCVQRPSEISGIDQSDERLCSLPWCYTCDSISMYTQHPSFRPTNRLVTQLSYINQCYIVVNRNLAFPLPHEHRLYLHTRIPLWGPAASLLLLFLRSCRLRADGDGDILEIPVLVKKTPERLYTAILPMCQRYTPCAGSPRKRTHAFHGSSKASK